MPKNDGNGNVIIKKSNYYIGLISGLISLIALLVSMGYNFALETKFVSINENVEDIGSSVKRLRSDVNDIKLILRPYNMRFSTIDSDVLKNENNIRDLEKRFNNYLERVYLTKGKGEGR